MEQHRDPKTSGAPRKPTANGSGVLLSENESTNDLPRFCLELDPAESKRALAWVNSVCFAYLMIGVLGLKPPAPAINRRAPVEEAVPTIIEPLVTAVQTVTSESSPEETTSERTSDEGAAVVAVTADSSAVAFSVPTVGNVVVPMSLAQAPPAHPMEGVVPVNSPRIEQISVTGVGGSRPAPPYPRDSLMNKEEGTVVLQIEVDESGKLASVTVKESSGYWRLDQATLEYVKRHWFFAPAKGTRLYDAPIIFQLK